MKMKKKCGNCTLQIPMKSKTCPHCESGQNMDEVKAYKAHKKILKALRQISSDKLSIPDSMARDIADELGDIPAMSRYLARLNDNG